MGLLAKSIIPNDVDRYKRYQFVEIQKPILIYGWRETRILGSWTLHQSLLNDERGVHQEIRE